MWPPPWQQIIFSFPLVFFSIQMTSTAMHFLRYFCGIFGVAVMQHKIIHVTPLTRDKLELGERLSCPQGKIEAKLS